MGHLQQPVFQTYIICSENVVLSLDLGIHQLHTTTSLITQRNGKDRHKVVNQNSFSNNAARIRNKHQCGRILGNIQLVNTRN